MEYPDFRDYKEEYFLVVDRNKTRCDSFEEMMTKAGEESKRRLHLTNDGRYFPSCIRFHVFHNESRTVSEIYAIVEGVAV